MTRTVVYVISWPAHLPYLIPSLWTLRKHWHGPVEVHCWEESRRFVERIAEDEQLDVRAVPFKPEYRGKNDIHTDKIQIAQRIDATSSMHLDADTTIHGSLDPLFEMAERYGFAATQFNDWVTVSRRSKLISGRLERLRQFPEIDQWLLSEVVARPWWSVNGGIWAACPDSPILPLWYEWTLAARSIFIADECVLHVLAAKFVPQGAMHVWEGGAYNCCPKHQPKNLPDEDVRIYHYHGHSAARPQKSPRGHAMWWKIWEECFAKNVGGVREWVDEAARGNRHWQALKKEKAACIGLH